MSDKRWPIEVEIVKIETEVVMLAIQTRRLMWALKEIAKLAPKAHLDDDYNPKCPICIALRALRMGWKYD